MRDLCLDEPFELRADSPRPKQAEFFDAGARQTMLLSGLDCLPDQQNLFETDGESTDGQS